MPTLRAFTLGCLAVLATGCADRSPSAPPSAARDLAHPPDLGLIELCPPKPLPPGALTKEEARRRDEARMQTRLADYQRQLAEYQQKKAEVQQAAARACDPLIEAARTGKPIDDAHGGGDTLAERLNGPIDRLVTCVAFAARSDTPCAASKSAAPACRFRRALYARAVAAPADREAAATAVADLAFAMCQRDNPKAGCPALRDAIRKGRPNACPKGEPGAACRLLAGGPSTCPPGKAGPTCSDPETWIGALSAGRFSGLWEGDAAADQALAAAAAGKADACTPLVDKLRSACAALAVPPLPDEPHRPEDVPGSTPSVPKAEGRTTDMGTSLPGAPAPAHP